MFDAHQLGRRQTGNETYVRALLREFDGRTDVDISALAERVALDDFDLRAFKTHRIPRSGLARLVSIGVAARRIHPDVIHAIYFAPPLAGAPLVLTVHDISYEMYPQFFSRSERLRGKTLIRDAARRAKFVITVSETSRRDLIDRYALAEDRVVAIPNGVAQPFLDVPVRPVEAIGDRPLRVLAIGTLQPRKNLPRLLDAINRVSVRRPVRLRVVGPDGFEADAIRSALSRGVGVEIVGYVSESSLVAEYLAADMLVYPSVYEGFGLPVVEAMACGVPVITTTGGSLPEVAGNAALIVNPFDVSALADSVLRVADDDALRADLVGKGRVRARSFSWEVSASRHIEVYRAAAG
jgi:glycosyltransferase involved in cell wall biosynthesis